MHLDTGNLGQPDAQAQVDVIKTKIGLDIVQAEVNLNVIEAKVKFTVQAQIYSYGLVGIPDKREKVSGLLASPQSGRT